jgi:hypothetical protein
MTLATDASAAILFKPHFLAGAATEGVSRLLPSKTLLEVAEIGSRDAIGSFAHSWENEKRPRPEHFVV